MLSKRRIAQMMFTIVAVATLSCAANASSAAGRFTLTTETHWGTAVLPAGKYAYTVEDHGATVVVLLRSMDAGPVAMIIPQSVTPTQFSQASRLTLSHIGGKVYVSEFYIKEMSMTLSYRLPAETNTVTARSGPVPALQSGSK